MSDATFVEPADRGRVGVEVLGAAAVVGIGLAAVMWQQRRSRRPDADDHRQALAAYLRQHLAASDVSIRVVDRLRLTHAGSREGRLFASLFDDFREERDVIRALLTGLRSSRWTPVRAAGAAMGDAGSLVVSGDSDRSMFRILEMLAVGVQAKRCLWRALMVLVPDDAVPGRRTLGGLEAMALRQWEAIEQRRQALAVEAFSGLDLPTTEPAVD
jgi:hypothetical protein